VTVKITFLPPRGRIPAPVGCFVLILSKKRSEYLPAAAMSPAQQLAIRSTPAGLQARGNAARGRRSVTVKAAKKAAAG
jgi:hypothetical protein